jgi:pimeloyl-ACP methyl ester carboxylesterase
LGENDKGHYVQVNGINMYFEDLGKGPPLILIHGGFSSARFNWGPHIPILSKEFRVIAPDCRGQGKTDNPGGHFSYGLMADDIIGLIKELDLDKPFVCGWSDGGQIVLEIGIRHPDAAGALVVGAALIEPSEHYLEGMKSMGIDGPGKVDIERLKKAYPEFVAAASQMHSPVYGEDYWKDLLVNISKMWANPQEFPGDRISNIVVPTLVLQGDRDDMIPLEDAITMYQKIPEAELAIVPNADHGSVRSKPELYCSIIADFLNRIGSR